VVIEEYKDIVSKSYGCYGAILEVAVAPKGKTESGEDYPLPQYPYIVDTYPNKRELYELVSETGEMLSRSLENVNVRKGNTTMDSHEVLDIFGGFNISGQGEGPAGGGGGSFGMQGQWGTRDISQEEFTNIRTTDRSRETRESFSHTTQLTQMYHQLISYHIGTNRAVFFMLPRPHIVQSENTFVNGPLLLEGKQEFMLVVMRPEAVKEICTEAYLETAHIVNEPKYEYETSTDALTLHIEKNCEDTSGSFGDDPNFTYAENSETYTPPDGWEVDLERDNGYKVDSVSGQRIEEYNVSAESDNVTAYGKISARFEDRTWPQSNVCYKGRLDMVVTAYIRKKKPNVVGYDQDLWLTGRGVCCGCKPKYPQFELPESVVFETPLKSTTEAPVGGSATMNIREANQLRANIGQLIINGVNHHDRYPFGKVSFTDTQFISRIISKIVRTEKHRDNHPIADIKGLDTKILKKVVRVAPKVSRGKLLQMPLAEQVDRFGLSYDDAVKLRRAALGLEGPLPNPRDRWDPPGQRRPGQISRKKASRTKKKN